ncbi:NuA4 histone H4 acetyltransferase complex and the SWR1 complex subunit [Cystobasidiomycetes sp. EMM_F5]
MDAIEKPPFEVTETGWGEFEIQIKIYFIPEANEKSPLTVNHLLKLHPWAVKDGIVVPALEPVQGSAGVDNIPVHSWQYDEIVFSEPTEPLYNILIQHTPTPL